MRIELDTERPPQLGLIVLQADETIEDDFRRLLPDTASLLVSRVASAPTVTRDTLRQMETHLTAAASLFPASAMFQGIAYGCTSGTAEIGAPRIAELVRAGADTPYVTEPVSALIAACRQRGIERLGLVSPYVASVTARLRTVLAATGIATPQSLNFDEPREDAVARISAHTVTDAAIEIGRHVSCDAVFLSCTNLRTLTVIATVEAEIGKPVLSSNQVLAWHLCALTGLLPASDAPGQLFRSVKHP